MQLWGGSGEIVKAGPLETDDDNFINVFHSLLRQLHHPTTPLERFFSRRDHLDQLQIEHTRLFINAVPSVVAPPYASAWLNGRLMGQITEKTLLFYQQHGYTLPPGGDPPDALVTELEFLALPGIGEEKEKEFLDNLFRPWFEKFKKCVLEEARLPYYPAALSLIDFFTQEDAL